MRHMLLLILAGMLGLGFTIPMPGTANPVLRHDDADMREAEPLLAQATGAEATFVPDHAFLIEKHVAAQIGCAGCHGKGIPTAEVPEAVCTQCHGSYDELGARFPFEPNPHRSHLGQLPCATCHKVHVESVNFCDSCHSFGMVMP